MRLTHLLAPTFLLALFFTACSGSDGDAVPGEADASTPQPAGGDAATTEPPGGGKDASTPPADSGSDASLPDGGGDSGGGDGGLGTGETCVGFGAKDPCGVANKRPDYGYVCFNGGPPGISGCELANKSIVGDTYCCSKLACVAQPDQDAKSCNGKPGKPHRFQCAIDKNDALLAKPGGGCEEDVAAKIPTSSRFYCCP